MSSVAILLTLSSFCGRMIMMSSAKSPALRTLLLQRVSSSPFSSSSVVRSSGQIFYTKKHEWVRVEQPGIGTVGISNYAQEALGDIVYAQLPEPDSRVNSGEECGALESVKAASEVFSPVSGVVTEKNDKVEALPSIINSSPTKDGWLFKVKMGEGQEKEMEGQLLSEEKYKEFLKTQEDNH